MFSFFLVLFLGGLLLAPITLSVLALSLLVDSGCLRVGAFLFGWFFLAPVTGLLLAGSLAIAAGMQGNLSAEAGVGGTLFLIGYPIIAFFLHRYFERLPEEDVETWKNTLTSGALFGFGAGSVGKAASGAASYGGFGGGSFGGGGAGGSFKGSAVASGKAANAAGSAGTVGKSSAEAATAASGTAAATASEVEARAADSEADGSPNRTSPAPREATDDGQRAGGGSSVGSFRIWHAAAFLLVAVAFVPLGIGLTVLFSQSWAIKAGLGLLGLYVAYRVWAWAYPSAAAEFAEWLARWRPRRYLNRVKRGEASAALLYILGLMVGGPFGLAGVIILRETWRSGDHDSETSFDGGAASSSWQ